MTLLKAVPGYEGLYQITDDGQVRTRDRYGEFIPKALNTDKNGYKRVTLSKSGVKKSHLVHHLVLKAFVGTRPDGMECRHLNGDPGDNRLVNLAWGSSSQNSYDVVHHGNHPHASKTHCKNGHEFTEQNTVYLRNGGRNCRTCNNERAAAWYLANRKTGVISNKDKTHCKRGHEFTLENTILRSDGGRQCRACLKQYGAERYRRMRATRADERQMND